MSKSRDLIIIEPEDTVNDALLPDTEISPDPLKKYKNSISAIFDSYISPWKLSIFGHHHNERAKAVKEQILKADDLHEISNILERQRILMTNSPADLPKIKWDDDRWNQRHEIKNKPTDINKSGYYKVIEEAKKVIYGVGVEKESEKRLNQ